MPADDRTYGASGSCAWRSSDVARGNSPDTRLESLSWLVGALALVDSRDEYSQVRQEASA